MYVRERVYSCTRHVTCTIPTKTLDEEEVSESENDYDSHDVSHVVGIAVKKKAAPSRRDKRKSLGKFAGICSDNNEENDKCLGHSGGSVVLGDSGACAGTGTATVTVDSTKIANTGKKSKKENRLRKEMLKEKESKTAALRTRLEFEHARTEQNRRAIEGEPITNSEKKISVVSVSPVSSGSNGVSGAEVASSELVLS